MTVERRAAYSLLQDEYLGKDSTDEEASEKRKTDRRSVSKEMIGEGYSFEGIFSIFCRHRALAVAQIKQIAGLNDILKQRRLAQSLLDHYTCVANCIVCQPYCAICVVYGTGLRRILHNTVSYIARWSGVLRCRFDMLHCAFICCTAALIWGFAFCVHVYSVHMKKSTGKRARLFSIQSQ